MSADGVATPVSTARESRPAATAPAMSVSRRSPTTSAFFASPAAVRRSGAAGLPATSGSAPVAVRRAATIEPLPGNWPRSVGRVVSTLQATHNAPARIATQASARSVQPVSVQ